METMDEGSVDLKKPGWRVDAKLIVTSVSQTQTGIGRASGILAIAILRQGIPDVSILSPSFTIVVKPVSCADGTAPLDSAVEQDGALPDWGSPIDSSLPDDSAVPADSALDARPARAELGPD